MNYLVKLITNKLRIYKIVITNKSIFDLNILDINNNIEDQTHPTVHIVGFQQELIYNH